MSLSKWTGKYERFGETTTSTFHPEGRPSSLHAYCRFTQPTFIKVILAHGVCTWTQ